MELEVLLSTMHQDEIEESFFEERKIKGSCVVVNQGDREERKKNFNDKTIIHTMTRGLSVSRNIALQNASKDICLIHDDDLYLEDGYEEIILKYYKELPDADIITFLITMGGELSDRVNSATVIKHNKHSILSVGSNEITFKRERMKEANLIFDERFGLGSNRFITGEESLFLTRALEKGLHIYHVPIIISHHIPKKGSNAFWTEKLIFSKAAFFRAYDKNLWLLYMIYLYVMKQSLIDPSISLSQYIKICMKGKRAYDESES